jgi:hypothetical protein
VKFIDPPDVMVRPGAARIDVGPPPDVSDEHCGIARATFERVAGGPFDGTPCFRVYAELDEYEIGMLQRGAGVIELSFFGTQMPMHSLAVEPTGGPE